MKKKRILAILLAAAMTVSLAACGGDSESAGSEGEYDQVTYAYATFNNVPAQEDLDTVEEAINEITREKINAEITLMPIAIAEYPNKVSLALQGGEKLDVYSALGDFNNYVSTDMAYDITDLLAEYGEGIMDTVGEEWLKACTVDDGIYGVPVMKPVALVPMVIYRQDLAEELGIDMSAVSSMEDLTEVLKRVKEAYPDMIPLAPAQTGEIGVSSNYGEIDFLTDDKYSPAGVLIGDSMEVEDLYSTDMFREKCELVRGWYEDSLVMRDAATTTSSATELMSSGNYFCYIAAYGYPEADTAAHLQPQCGSHPIAAKMIGEAYLSTVDVNGVCGVIASTTDVPEAAMKFLDLTYTDKDIINLLIYGIEGRDYVLDEEGMVSYPEGEDGSTVPYTAQLSNGLLGNYFLMYQGTGSDPAALDWEMEQNRTAKTSPAMGFTFNSDSVKTQYTAVQNVITQYLPGLICGSLDPDTEIDKFIKALNDAGYQDILNAKQEQLDAWAAEQ